MKDIEIVIFNDKSWVRLTEYQKLDEELKNEKYLNAEIKKRLIEVEYDCEELNHEYCDPNCNGKRKETIDLLQLISDGLNETLLKQKDEELKQEKQSLAKRIYELQSDLSRAKSQIEKMRCCENCINYTKLFEFEGCDCKNLSNWRMENEKKN